MSEISGKVLVIWAPKKIALTFLFLFPLFWRGWRRLFVIVRADTQIARVQGTVQMRAHRVCCGAATLARPLFSLLFFWFFTFACFAFLWGFDFAVFFADAFVHLRHDVVLNMQVPAIPTANRAFDAWFPIVLVTRKTTVEVHRFTTVDTLGLSFVQTRHRRLLC